MTPQEAENGRRTIARERYHELDDKRRTILKKHLRQFTSLLTDYHHKRSIPAIWLNVYLFKLEKERKDG